MCAAGHLLALWARPTRRRFEPSLGPQVQAAQPVGLVALAKSIGAANGDRAELLRRAQRRRRRILATRQPDASTQRLRAALASQQVRGDAACIRVQVTRRR